MRVYLHACVKLGKDTLFFGIDQMKGENHQGSLPLLTQKGEECRSQRGRKWQNVLLGKMQRALVNFRTCSDKNYSVLW